VDPTQDLATLRSFHHPDDHYGFPHMLTSINW